MSYILRLIDDQNKEVHTDTVEPLLNCPKYPAVRQMIGDWRVLGVIRHTDAEYCLRVERISGDAK